MTGTAPERADEYHANKEQRLSSTLARQLILKTPAHAKAIMDGEVTFDSDAMTTGTAVHQLLLRDDRVDVLEFDSYRTKDAQAARSSSSSAGRVPILRHKFDEAREIAQRVNGQILELELADTPFTHGTPEHVVRWTENGVDCRALLDWVRHDNTYIDDLKTTTDASPAKFARHIFNLGYDIQAAFYIRAIRASQDTDPVFRWIVVETKPPYPVTVHTLSDQALYAAHVKVDAALQLWKDCMASGVWPAYPNSVQLVHVPGWSLQPPDAWSDVELEDVPF